MRQGEVRDGRWWDWGAWWRWYLVRPLGWVLAGQRDRWGWRVRYGLALRTAGLRDRAATWRANRSRDIVR